MPVLGFHLPCAVAFLSAVAGCGIPAPSDLVGCDRYTGAEAEKRIRQRAHLGAGLPESARNFYLYDGGNFNGSIEYIAFDCGSIEDCHVAASSLGAPDSSRFEKWIPSRYAVIMEGPGFYKPEARDDPWDVRDIENGVAHEHVQGDRRLEYYAIDLDRKRVYYHLDSGGFPTKVYQPKAQE